MNNIQNYENEITFPIVTLNWKDKTNFTYNIHIKFWKNRGFFLSLVLFTLFYYTFLFETMLPMYNIEMYYITSGNIHSLVTNSTQIISSKSNENMNSISTTMILILVFHVLVFLFLCSFLRLAIMDPGHLDQEYVY